MSRLLETLAEKPILILDGAMGTELEKRGYDVSGTLWSAKYLLGEPSPLIEIHKAYLEAGADLVTTASYQASYQGLLEAGLTKQQTILAIKESVHIARVAIKKVWADLSEREKEGRLYPFIAGSVGPYGAYLADGSEYTGAYQLTKEEFQNFHRPRIKALVEGGVDLLAFETIPNLTEARALLELLYQEYSNVPAYLSFTSQDGQHISDGSSLKKVVELVNCYSAELLAVGINCSKPAVTVTFLKQLRRLTDKEFVVYPNSGEEYDGINHAWYEEGSTTDLHTQAKIYQKLGARFIGGCCRTRPVDIAGLAEYFH